MEGGKVFIGCSGTVSVPRHGVPFLDPYYIILLESDQSSFQAVDRFIKGG